jgi:hypothetical protein
MCKSAFSIGNKERAMKEALTRIQSSKCHSQTLLFPHQLCCSSAHAQTEKPTNLLETHMQRAQRLEAVEVDVST